MSNRLFLNSSELAQDAVGGIFVDSSSIDFTYADATPSITAVVLPAGVDHNSLANLTIGDVHTQYALLAGRTTPQTVAFGNASGASTGYLTSTSHATKGKYFLNAAGTLTIDEVNVRLGIGTATPGESIHSTGKIFAEQNFIAGTGLADADVINIANAKATFAAIFKLQTAGVDKWSLGRGAVTGGANFEFYNNATGHNIFSIISINDNFSLDAVTGVLILNRLTTTQRDALTPVNGMLIYNTTLAKFQGYENGTWTNLI